MGSLKGKYVPEHVRATVMNYFRIPTNLFVLLVLNNVKHFSYKYVFAIAIGLLFISTTAQYVLPRNKEQKPEASNTNPDLEKQ